MLWYWIADVSFLSVLFLLLFFVSKSNSLDWRSGTVHVEQDCERAVQKHETSPLTWEILTFCLFWRQWETVGRSVEERAGYWDEPRHKNVVCLCFIHNATRWTSSQKNRWFGDFGSLSHQIYSLDFMSLQTMCVSYSCLLTCLFNICFKVFLAQATSIAMGWLCYSSSVIRLYHFGLYFFIQSLLCFSCAYSITKHICK